MSIKMRLHPEARIDYIEGAEYYESRLPGLGKDFASEVEAAIQRIAENPRGAALAGSSSPLGEIRRRVLHRFPFSIVYILTNEFAEIVAIAHGRRRPNYWRSRVP